MKLRLVKLIQDLGERVDRIPNASKDDLLIILGDCAFFYNTFYGKTDNDFERQEYAADLPITILCIQGNHEVPFKEMPAEGIKIFGGNGYVSRDIYFAENGVELTINEKSIL